MFQSKAPTLLFLLGFDSFQTCKGHFTGIILNGKKTYFTIKVFFLNDECRKLTVDAENKTDLSALIATEPWQI